MIHADYSIAYSSERHAYLASYREQFVDEFDSFDDAVAAVHEEERIYLDYLRHHYEFNDAFEARITHTFARDCGKTVAQFVKESIECVMEVGNGHQHHLVY